MRMLRRSVFCWVAGAVMAVPAAVWADSITPGSYSDVLNVGESVTITKTVTISSGGPTSALLDVMFLFDTTGSMGGLLYTATSSASAITSALSSFGDTQFGVAEYKDFYTGYESSGWGWAGDYPYKLNQDFTSDTAAVSSAISGLYASGGRDLKESGLYALNALAGAEPETAPSWRTGSTRVVVWFGDAPCHDPLDTPGYPGPTPAEVVSSLNAENITVVAVDLSNMDYDGDVTTVTSGTGGSKYSGSVSSSTIVDVIKDLVSGVFASYSEVTLDVVGDTSGVDVSWTPGSYTGSFTRDTDRDFTFDVTFTGTAPGVYDFTVRALVDGGVVARELDTITVRRPGGPAPVPEPGTMVLLGSGLVGLVARSRRRRR